MGDKSILLILPRMQGFFSLVFQAVGHAYLMEKTHSVCVVYFNRHCPYWSDAGYNDSRNVWEYYFEPLSDRAIQDVFDIPLETLESLSCDEFKQLAQNTRVTATNRYPDVIEYWSPIGIGFERTFVHGLLNKYVRIKPSLQHKLNEFCETQFLSRPILGVHYRGMEKTHGEAKDWVISRNAADLKAFYLKEMKRYLQKHRSARIFVATDSQNFLDEARSLFGEAILFRKAARLEKSEEVVGLHFSPTAKSHGPILGEEVLLDALTLSRTDFLIHGVSNVSNAALFFNPQLRHTDIEVRYGKTGMYVRREVIRQIRRRSPRLAAQVQRLSALIRS
jgi:hypothetical protein